VVHIVDEDRGAREAVLSDRRRPNRQPFKNPHLIALLRGQRVAEPSPAEVPAAPVVEPDVEYDRNGLTAARGIGYSLLFGSALWALMALLWHFV
jgi:hypothetical protein